MSVFMELGVVFADNYYEGIEMMLEFNSMGG